jgi:hypothetical protein
MAAVGAATLAALLLAAPLDARMSADLVETLGRMDGEFICPQFLPGEEERRAERTRFAEELATLGLNYVQATRIRADFLARHNCVTRRAAATPDGTPMAAAN